MVASAAAAMSVMRIIGHPLIRIGRAGGLVGSTPRYRRYNVVQTAANKSILVDLVLAAAPVDRGPRAWLLDPVEVLGRRVLAAGPPRADRTGGDRIAAAGVAPPGERIVARLDRRSLGPRRRRAARGDGSVAGLARRIVAPRRGRLDRARCISSLAGGARRPDSAAHGAGLTDAAAARPPHQVDVDVVVVELVRARRQHGGELIAG